MWKFFITSPNYVNSQNNSVSSLFGFYPTLQKFSINFSTYIYVRVWPIMWALKEFTTKRRD